MKNFLINIILTCLIIFNLGCSSTPKLENSALNKTYSSTTEEEFASIEKNGFNNQLDSIKRLENDQMVKQPKIEPAVAVSNSRNQEKLQEINQNLAFFCMKKRKDVVFSNEEKCQAFTKKVLNDCERKHPTLNSSMLICIKEHLKKGVR